MNATIIILSDPKATSDEALGRLFNGLAAAYEFKQRGENVSVQFQGAGTRWPGVLADPDHPVFALFEAVKDTVAGVSCGCADVFSDSAEIEASGFDLIRDNTVPGTTGLPSLHRLVSDGHTILTF